ncbi:MAG: ABC transporter ATP-binding protein [Chitinivibrionia bacterium]|nr:ABC transporter ATP-binding protein [Chitinivibrionia bacterium]
MLQVDSLKKKYDSVEALKGVSFSVGAGEIYGLLGPNGAGKSSAINIIAGILSPTSGTVTVSGHSIITDAVEAKKAMGIVLQEAVLVEELSALQNCMFFGSLYGIPAERLKKRSLDLLSWIGLSDRARDPVEKFSGGMKQRLSLVLGVLHEPSLLVLDEPTVGLDPQTRLLILDSIREISRKGTGVLFSTHYLEEAERLCDRVGIIDDGRIIAEGTLASLREAVENVQIVTLRGALDAPLIEEAVAPIAGGRILLRAENEMVISLPSRSDSVAALVQKISSLGNVKEVSIRPPSLENLFINLTGKQIRD